MAPEALLRILAVCALLAPAGCANRGREVFLREGCGNCHRFRELGGGGAPDLTDLGSRRDAAWVAAQISDPTAHDPSARMPAFPRISRSDRRSLVAFLRR